MYNQQTCNHPKMGTEKIIDFWHLLYYKTLMSGFKETILTNRNFSLNLSNMFDKLPQLVIINASYQLQPSLIPFILSIFIHFLCNRIQFLIYKNQVSSNLQWVLVLLKGPYLLLISLLIECSIYKTLHRDKL